MVRRPDPHHEGVHVPVQSVRVGPGAGTVVVRVEGGGAGERGGRVAVAGGRGVPGGGGKQNRWREAR